MSFLSVASKTSKYLLIPLTLYVSIPLIFKWSGKYGQKLIYLTQFKNVSDIKNPKSNGVKGVAKNIYIKDRNGNNIGIYYIQAHSEENLIENNEKNFIKETQIIKSKRPFILYFHGAKGCRASGSRIKLYNTLSQEIDCNVLALDYSGFGDSEGEANIDNIVDSANALIDFAEFELKCNFITWGHSLGGGVLLEALTQNNFQYDYHLGAVLESTFTSLKDSLYHHPYTSIYNWNTKIMDNFIIGPLNKQGLVMNNIVNISKLSVPILILHAVDDDKIPVQLGQKLYEEAITKGKNVDMVIYEKNQRLGHSEVCQASSFKKDVQRYINNCMKGCKQEISFE
uniref:Peptidase_S9 domain-containing protein n=1 Tax=Parastrongyloides trichosuri TaxID=131310 RepID=A0A0N5A1Y4_PARTI